MKYSKYTGYKVPKWMKKIIEKGLCSEEGCTIRGLMEEISKTRPTDCEGTVLMEAIRVYMIDIGLAEPRSAGALYRKRLRRSDLRKRESSSTGFFGGNGNGSVRKSSIRKVQDNHGKTRKKGRKMAI